MELLPSTSYIQSASMFAFMHCCKIKFTLKSSDRDWTLIRPIFHLKHILNFLDFLIVIEIRLGG